MSDTSFRWADLLWFLIIVAVAAGVRFGYQYEFLNEANAAPVFVTQDAWPAVDLDTQGKPGPNRLDQLVSNIRDDNWFAGTGPLSPAEEDTAHVAPGYPWLVSLAYRWEIEDVAPTTLVRWTQCGLGALAAGFFFLFARRAFRSLSVALLAGLLCAFHPFWIANTAEINDGVLVTFLLAFCLMSGTRAGEAGGAVTSVFFGLALAALALVRAALLPFSFVALLWFLLRCRTVPRGWLCAIVALLGFANGLAAWTVQNYRRFGDVIPVADSAFVAIWIGNNPDATGGPMTEAQLRRSFSDNRLQELLAKKNQSRRYQMLSKDVAEFAQEHPVACVKNRLRAMLYFYFGESWFNAHAPSWSVPHQTSTAATDDEAPLRAWLTPENQALLVNSLLLGMLIFGVLGWRWTHAWRKQAGLATLAMIWIPLPYILSHAEYLWGPRLPLDGVLLCLAAFAIVYVMPLARRGIAKGPQRRTRREDEI